jgi:hypothetical protein
VAAVGVQGIVKARRIERGQRIANDLDLDFPQVARLERLTDAIRNEALAEARQHSGDTTVASGLAELLARPDFVDHLALALAAKVAGLLASHDPRLLAVYGYRPALSTEGVQRPEMKHVLALHLLIVVVGPSAALTALVASLRRALESSLWALPDFRRWQGRLVLDANVITPQDYLGGLGLDGLLFALKGPPVKLWGSEIKNPGW